MEVVALPVVAVGAVEICVAEPVDVHVERVLGGAGLLGAVVHEVGEQRHVVEDGARGERAGRPARDIGVPGRVEVRVVGRSPLDSVSGGDRPAELAHARRRAALPLAVGTVVVVVAGPVGAERAAQVDVGVVVARQLEALLARATLPAAASHEVAEQRDVVEDGAGSEAAPGPAGDVGVALGVVVGVVDGRPLHAVARGHRAAELADVLAGAVLSDAALRVVPVIASPVGAERAAQVDVGVVVAGELEGRLTRTPFLSAAVHEVLQQRGVVEHGAGSEVAPGPIGDVGVALCVVVGVVDRSPVHPLGCGGGAPELAHTRGGAAFALAVYAVVVVVAGPVGAERSAQVDVGVVVAGELEALLARATLLAAAVHEVGEQPVPIDGAVRPPGPVRHVGVLLHVPGRVVHGRPVGAVQRGGRGRQPLPDERVGVRDPRAAGHDLVSGVRLARGGG